MKAIEILIIFVALAKSAVGGSGKCTYIRYRLLRGSAFVKCIFVQKMLCHQVESLHIDPDLSSFAVDIHIRC